MKPMATTALLGWASEFRVLLTLLGATTDRASLEIAGYFVVGHGACGGAG